MSGVKIKKRATRGGGAVIMPTWPLGWPFAAPIVLQPPQRSTNNLSDALAAAIRDEISRQSGDNGNAGGSFRLLRPSEAAKMLGLSRSALYAKIQAGEIPAVRDGRAVMIDIRDLEMWAKARKGRG